MLDNGVMYRVLEEGHGTKKPTHEGDKWEVYIPAHSTLIFTLQLVKIER